MWASRFAKLLMAIDIPNYRPFMCWGTHLVCFICCLLGCERKGHRAFVSGTSMQAVETIHIRTRRSDDLVKGLAPEVQPRIKNGRRNRVPWIAKFRWFGQPTSFVRD